MFPGVVRHKMQTQGEAPRQVKPPVKASAAAASAQPTRGRFTGRSFSRSVRGGESDSLESLLDRSAAIQADVFGCWDSTGPANSTMVEGGVPITQMPPPRYPPKKKLRLCEAAGKDPRFQANKPDEKQEDGATLTELEWPDEIPPCPLGLLWEMQREEIRKAGVSYSWELQPRRCPS
ncbi:uncharacterized protein LOC144168354 [Haemaphysalis longicornis]